MLSNFAVTAYVLPTRKLARFAAFSARNTIASRPSSTNRPTIVSILLRPIADSVHLGALNISAVSTKSSPSTASEDTTTVRVVACATPSGVACASYPW